MKNKVRKLLLSLGVNPSLLGYDYLVEAITVSYNDRKYIRYITKELYPYIANQNKTTTSKVERAIRHATEKASNACTDMQEKLIVAPCLHSGKYTNSQFISACVEKLKMEE